jgi:hypothetical protein
MNAFYEHHKNNIRFHYRCFDRILLNGTIQPFQQEQRVVGFFTEYRHLYPVSRDVLRDIATQFHNWVKADDVVCIIKAREPARILTAIGSKAKNRWHLTNTTPSAPSKVASRLFIDGFAYPKILLKKQEVTGL